MKHWFVLDEGVVIWAATLQNPNNPGGDRDVSASVLLLTMIANCHGVALDNAVFARWSAQLDLLQRQNRVVQATIFSLLTQVGFNSDKVWFLPDSPELQGEDAWSSKLQDDRDFIRLAAQSHGVLATHDDPLIRDILSLGLANQHEFGVATVPQAIGLAAEPSI